MSSPRPPSGKAEPTVDQIETQIAAESAHLEKVVEQYNKVNEELKASQQNKINSDLAKLYELRRRAYASRTPTAATTTATPPAVSGKAGVAVKYAYAALGKPYVWGAEGPNGYDCSGHTLAAWRAAGVSVPHTAGMQWNALPHVGRGLLQAGDLVFYSRLGHVGIYARPG